MQVFLNTIDASYDGGGDWWFPYSTERTTSVAKSSRIEEAADGVFEVRDWKAVSLLP